MDAIVLAGGFAKRMWPLTKNMPKHLLEVGGRPMLHYVLENLDGAPVSRKIVSTNARFQDHFRHFLESWPEVELAIEPTRSEEEKLGSLGALIWLIDSYGLGPELLIVGGDNIMSLSLGELARHSIEEEKEVVAAYDIGDRKLAALYGVLDVDEEGRITNFLEKPEQPPTTLVATACYALTGRGTAAFRRYIAEGGKRDAMGHFMEWAIERLDVHAHIFDGYWFDIGSIEVLQAADEFFSTGAHGECAGHGP